MKESTFHERQELRWESKYKKAQERIKESFWGDFIFGGLLISGIFIIVDNLDLPRITNLVIGAVLAVFATSLMYLSLKWPTFIRQRIDKLMDKAYSYITTERYEKALAQLDKVIKLDEDYILAHSNKGNVLSSIERFDNAIKCYNNAIELDEFYTPPIANKGFIFEKWGRYEDALECYKTAFNINSDSTAYSRLVLLLEDLGRFEETVMFLDDALANNKVRDIMKFMVWIRKGKSLIKLNRFEEAATCFNRVINSSPVSDWQHQEAIYHKARIESLNNNPEIALLLLREVIELASSYKEMANSEPDFKNISGSPEFKKLVEID